MARSAKKQKYVDENQIDMALETKRDFNPYWRSSLFSDVYLKNDVPRKYKNFWDHDEISDETSGYRAFYEGFLNLCHELDHESFDNWKEADTVKNWILPIMTLLGWENNSEGRQNSCMDNESFTVLVNGKKQTYRPDLVYFDKPTHKTYTQKEKEFEKKLNEVRDPRTGAKIVVEAKYWNRLAQSSNDKKRITSDEDSASGLGAELQTLKYMDIFNHDFGILSDGKTWRLFHKELSQGMDRRSYDFDLGRLRELALDNLNAESEAKYSSYAKYFYYFFAKQSLVKEDTSSNVPFVYEVFDYSKKYAHSIEEDLKKRFIVTMGVACNALKNSCDDQGEEADLEMIRNVAESHLFQILFVKSCEVRHILPIKSGNYIKVSLHEVIESLDVMRFDPDKDWDDYLVEFMYGQTFGGKDFSYDGYEIFNRFINLYEVIHDGTSKKYDYGFEIEGFKESIFSKNEWKFAKKHKINNRDMIQILFMLNFIEANFSGRKYQQIPYSYFTPRQLGSIYESFLEYRLEQADCDMVFQKGKWSKANLKSDKVKSLKLVDSHIVKEDELFFSPDNKDRKMTGSYYTPDYIVKYIVQSTLGPLVENRTSKEILDLKVCDPAMGSGHFLAGALDFLVEEYRKKWSEENLDDLSEPLEVTSRRVLDACLYGVDINSRAVKLANMTLWLVSAFSGKKLERLSDQLKCGNSVIDDKNFTSNSFNWQKQFPNVFMEDGFDAIIGNPPYGANIDKFINYFKEKFQDSIGKYVEIYKIFLVTSIGLLRSGGKLGMITPNTFIAQPRYSDIRKFLLQFNIEQVINLGDNVFSEAVVPTAIVCLSNDTFGNKFNFIDAQVDNKFIGDIREGILEEINFEDILSTKDFSFKPKYVLKSNELFLEDVFVLKDGGIQHHRSGIGLKNKGGNNLRDRIYSNDSKKFKNVKKVWYGKLLKPYSLEEDTDEFFNLDFKKCLKSNESVSFSKEAFSIAEKILWRQTASHLVATIDTTGAWFRNTIQCGWIRDEYKSKLELKYILALFNSNYFKYLYGKIVSESSGKVFPQVKLTYLRQLPIKMIPKNEQKVFVKLVDKLLNGRADIIDDDVLNEINNLVCKLYNIEDESFLKNIAA